MANTVGILASYSNLYQPDKSDTVAFCNIALNHAI